jgi:preprotein translocase subunit Sss1
VRLPDAELTRVCQELVSVIASIPEDERAGWYRSMERYTRHPHRNGHYNMAKVAGAALRLMGAVWPEWPPQRTWPEQ